MSKKVKKPSGNLVCHNCKMDEKGRVKTYYFARAGNRPLQLCYQCFVKVNEQDLKEFANLETMI